MKRSCVSTLFQTFGALLVAIPAFAQGPVGPCDGGAAPAWQKELFIIHPCVVDNARAHHDGPWSFGTLMRRLSGTSNPTDQSLFVRRWLETWTDPTASVNGVSIFHPMKAAMVQHFIDQWQAASQPSTSLDLDIAPFRLIAIVNRIDLLKASGSQVTSAGEARFIFAAIDQDPALGPNVTNGQFFVIFEYGIPANSCAELQAWASRWRDLGSHENFDEGFCSDLEAITNTFTGASAIGPNHPANGTWLNQLRTNDISVPGKSSPFWELREFQLLPTPTGFSALTNVTCKQEPRRSFVDSGSPQKQLALSRFLYTNKDAILAGAHTVPDFVVVGGASEAFLTGRAENGPGHSLPPNTPGWLSTDGTRWWAPQFGTEVPPPYDPHVRAGFAQQTCSGCHRMETGTPNFTMASSRQFGQPATLSPFLTGITIVDTIRKDVEPTLTHSFNDLVRRTTAMDAILAMDCGAVAPGALHPVIQLLVAATGSRVH